MGAQGRIAELSLCALELAAALDADQDAVARWLYEFGRLPRSRSIDRDFGPGDEPMGVLGLSRGSSSRRLLEGQYIASADGGWYAFFSATALREEFHPAAKLYVSPRPEALADAFPVIARTFVDADVRSFKVARGPGGLLRPDKIVAYFSDSDRLGDVAEALARRLSGLPAQGVPFTAEIAGDGMLSWGVDPDHGATGVSWRSWVTNRLARSLVLHADEDDQVGATLADISAAGVDPVRWLVADGAGPRRGLS